MEDSSVATESVSAQVTPTPSVEPTVEMATGGATDNTPKLGWVAIMMLGLTSKIDTLTGNKTRNGRLV